MGWNLSFCPYFIFSAFCWLWLGWFRSDSSGSRSCCFSLYIYIYICPTLVASSSPILSFFLCLIAVSLITVTGSDGAVRVAVLLFGDLVFTWMSLSLLELVDLYLPLFLPPSESYRATPRLHLDTSFLMFYLPLSRLCSIIFHRFFFSLFFFKKKSLFCREYPLNLVYLIIGVNCQLFPRLFRRGFKGR